MPLNVNLNLPRSVTVRLSRGTKEFLMAQVLNLTAAVDRLTAAVDRVVAGGGGTTGVPQTDVDAEAARIDEQSQRLESLPTPSTGDGSTAAAAARHK